MNVISILQQLVSFGNLTRNFILKKLTTHLTICLSQLDFCVELVLSENFSFIDKSYIGKSLVYILFIKWSSVYDDIITLCNKIYEFRVPITTLNIVLDAGKRGKEKKRRFKKKVTDEYCKVVRRKLSSLKVITESKKIEIAIGFDGQKSNICRKTKYSCETQEYSDIGNCLDSLMQHIGSNNINNLCGLDYSKNVDNSLINKSKCVKRRSGIKKNFLYDSCIHYNKNKCERNTLEKRFQSKDKQIKLDRLDGLIDISDTKLFELISPGYSRYNDRLLTLRHIVENSIFGDHHVNFIETKEILDINRQRKIFKKRDLESYLLQFITDKLSSNAVDGSINFTDVINPKIVDRRDASRYFMVLLNFARNNIIYLQDYKNSPVIRFANNKLSV